MTSLSFYVSESLSSNNSLTRYAFDVLGDLIFGAPFGFLETSSDYGNWIEALDRMLPVLATMSVLPANYRVPYLMAGTLWKSMRQQLQDLGQLTVTAKGLVQKRQDELEDAKNEKVKSRRDVLAKLFEVQATKGEKEDFTLPDIQMESYVNLLAGSDTTAIAMQSLIYHLLTHPEKYTKLLDELDSANLTLPIKYTDSLNSLPYFAACAKEAMRLHPSVGLQLPRHPPPEGAELSGYFFPHESRVGINPAVLHFDKTIFGEDANEFRPERWFGDKDQISQMDVSILVLSCEGRY